MEELFKEVFESLPHVTRIWVDANGEYSLHYRKNCEVVERPKEEAQSEVVETKKTKRKK